MLLHRLTKIREFSLLGRAIQRCSGIEAVLDLPCGTGQFLPLFEALNLERLIAADMSLAMLQIAESNKPQVRQFDCLHTDPLAIDLPDNAVDMVNCQHFFHSLSEPEDRAQALSEFHRVAKSFVVINVWVDGNLQSWWRHRHTLPVCRTRNEVEQEFKQGGFEIIDHYNSWPLLGMASTYLLGVS